MNHKIPLLLLTGFLGSGKTSLLNHLLEENKGLKIGVIVNDFGAINIDSLLVARQTDSQLELSNGCICCSLEEGGLDDAIGQLAHAGSLLDYIVIEASGLAEPRELAFVVQQSKNKYARLDAVVAVVDAENVLEMDKKHPDFFKQLDSADIIILNKVDLVSDVKLKEIEGYLRFLNSQARIIKSEYGRVDSRLLLDPDAEKHREVETGEQLSLGDDHDHHEHIHDSFQKIEFSCAEPLDPKAFESYMKEHIPENIYRAKGFVYFGMKGLEQKFTFQLVGKRFTLSADEWHGKVPKTDIVLIGTQLNEKKLVRDLQKLIDQKPNDIAGNLLDLSLYR